MLIVTEIVNIISIIVLAYSIYTIKQRNIASKHTKILTSTMAIYLACIILDRVNFYLIKSLSLEIAIPLLKIPLTIILIIYFIKLMRNKGSL